MTGQEIAQLRVWGKYDGYYLAVIWTLSFIALMNASFCQPLLLVNEVLMLVTPFFVYRRLRKFRDEGRGGVISFRCALYFLLWLFLNACLVLGLVQFFYLYAWDDGQLVKLMSSMINTPEYEQMFRQMGMTTEQYLKDLSSITPLTFASTFFILNVVVCTVLSFILAAIGVRQQKSATHQ